MRPAGSGASSNAPSSRRALRRPRQPGAAARPRRAPATRQSRPHGPQYTHRRTRRHAVSRRARVTDATLGYARRRARASQRHRVRDRRDALRGRAALGARGRHARVRDRRADRAAGARRACAICTARSCPVLDVAALLDLPAGPPARQGDGALVLEAESTRLRAARRSGRSRRVAATRPTARSVDASAVRSRCSIRRAWCAARSS